MKYYLTTLLIYLSIISFSQSRKGQFKLEHKAKSHTMYICFTEQIQTDSDINLISKNSKLSNFINENNIQLLNSLENNISKLYKQQKNQINSVKKLSRIYKVNVENSSNTNLLILAKELENFTEVEYVSLISNTPIEPPRILKTFTEETPNLESFQNYLLQDPGIDVKYAWSIGITGQNINIKDIEYGYKPTHEMIINNNKISPEPNISINPILLDTSSEYNSWLDHGTSVTSILMSKKDNIGIEGTTHNANEFVAYFEWTAESYDRIEAVTRALNNSKAGDVVLYEMQTGGQNDEYVLAEYDNVIWDLTKADTGIIVVAAAGNGSQNLDNNFYKPYMARGNSGAIVVGAGSSNTDHSILYFSTYGSRVDLQGWGNNVLSAGYGDWKKYNNDPNRTYTLFSGTSSATPIVSSAIVLVQSYYFSKTGKYLTPLEMKNLLVETGTPQNGLKIENKIGPLPNIKKAIEKLNLTLKINETDLKPFEIKVYPNPASQFIQISSNLSDTVNYELFNMTGQLLKKGTTTNNTKIDISYLTKGIYLIKAIENDKITIEKLIIK